MTNYDKLINTLKEVFMLDKAELDFGIYRIMNQKRKDIEQFLEVDLVPQVQKVLSESLSVDKQSLQKELDDAIKSAQALGADPNTLPKVQDLKKRLGEAADMVGIENEVFSLLANFFKRYFDNGDFISMRRYKKDVYAIPYEGEEVKLHWANADQYYIKTSEYFKVYRFKLSNGKTVAFELIEASTEQNNNKAQGDKERRFAIYLDKVCETVADEFKIYFTYEPTDKKVKQSDLLDDAFDAVKNQIPEGFTELLSLRPTEKDKQRTLLQKHLLDYTARNTFDYFIHKDLGGFLGRELDFYIKNEVLFIDDLNTRDEQEFLKQLSKIKAIKKIGEKIITFLAQLENFQKKLWLKKKLVVECNYCITLDRIPKELYPEILVNQAQIQEWINLFCIDDIKKQKAGGLFPDDKVGFSNPLTLEFLNQNQFLLLNTALFPDSFKWKLLGSFEMFDTQCDGLLINSDNFQALGLLDKRYHKMIDVTYIDPPYNTDATPILYKNNFKDSSWLSLIENRISKSLSFLNESHGTLSVAIDDIEVDYLTNLIKQSYNQYEIHRVIVNHYPGSGTGRSNVSRTHEYNIFAIPKDGDILRGAEKEDGERERSFRRAGTGENNYRKGRPNSFFAIVVDKHNFKIVRLEEPPVDDNYSKADTDDGFKRIYPIGEDGSERVWSLSYEGALKALDDKMLVCSKSFTIIRKYNDEKARDLLQSVWLSNKFNATSNGTNLLTDILGKSGLFSYPKSVHTIFTAIDSVLQNTTNGIVLDYFGGSGTTAHAVILRNRIGYDSTKYVLVEMGEYFDTVTKPRIQKIIYSKDWKDGKPVSREGVSHCFKYMRLESYEDTLNNLSLKQSEIQQQTLAINPAFKEGYMLDYMLDVETQGSLLNLEWFANPFNCFLNVTRNNELQPTKVDLVETFNYLIGLVVESYAVPKEGYVVVTGKNLAGESILVVWRDCTQHNSTALNQFLEKSKYNPLDSEYDRIYVNGDNNVENLKTGDERWKVVLIEEEFKKKMFETI